MKTSESHKKPSESFFLQRRKFPHPNFFFAAIFFPAGLEGKKESYRIFVHYRTWVNEDIVDQTCGTSYQCKFDYSVTLSREFAVFTKYYQDQFINIREGVLRPEARVISCGALPTPANGRKSTFAFTPVNT